MNGHTLKGYTFNGLALFRAEPGGTITFCDCVGTGAIVAKVNPNDTTQTGGVAEVVDSNTWFAEERLDGGIVNLYGGTLKSENPKGSVITAEYHQDYSNDYNAGHINIYGGAVEAQPNQAAIGAARHATLTIAGGSSITGDVYASDMTIGTKNGDKVIINGVLKGAEEATTIQSLVNTNITKLEANASYKNPIESCTIGEISGRANVTIKDSTILSGTLNIYNSDSPEDRDVTIINSNLHDTVVGGRNITIENDPASGYTVGSIIAKEFYIWQDETVERSTVSLSGVTVNGDVTIDPAGWRDSESSLTLKDTTVTGTVRTAGSADTITVDGAVNVEGRIELKDGQKITIGENLSTNNSKINISCEQPGDIIQNPGTNTNLGPVFTSTDGELTFDNKGQVTYAPQNNTSHTDGATYTALTGGGTLKSGHYYLSRDLVLTKPIKIPADAEVTLCLHGFDLTASSEINMIENSGTLHLQNCMTFSGNYSTIRYTGTSTFATVIQNYPTGKLDFVDYKTSSGSDGFCRLNIDGGAATAIENRGTFTWNVQMDGDRHGTITSAGPKTINNQSGGTLTINGPGVVKNTSTNSTYMALYNNGTVNLNYSSSAPSFSKRESYPTIVAEGEGSAIVTTADMTIYSPVIGKSTSSAALVIDEGCNVQIVDNGQLYTDPQAGSVTNSNGAAIEIRRSSTLTVNGTVTGKGSDKNGAVINSNSTVIVNVDMNDSSVSTNGGTFTSEKNFSNTPIMVKGGTVNLTGSTITGSAITATGGTLNLTNCTSTNSPVTITGAAVNVNGGSYSNGSDINLNDGSLTFSGAVQVNSKAQIVLAAGKTIAMSNAANDLRVNVQVAGTGPVATGVPSADCVTIMGSYKKVFENGTVTAEQADGHTHDGTSCTVLTNIADTLETGHYFLQDDVKATKQLVIPDNANVTICLNGHSWTGYEAAEEGNTDPAIKLGKNATLTIMDDSTGKTGTISAQRLTQVSAGATLNLNSGDVTHPYKNRALSCIDNDGGTVNFNDGTSTVTNTTAPFLTGTGTVNVNGGTWCVNSHGFAVLTGGTLNLVGGTVRYEDDPSYDDVLISVENTTVNLSGTIVAACTAEEGSSGGTAMELKDSSTLTMTGGELRGLNALKVGEGSNATLTKGSVSGKPFTGDRFANQSAASDGRTFENAGTLTVEADMAITGSNNFLKNTGTATIKCGGMNVDGTMFEIGGGTVNANFTDKLIVSTMFKITDGASFTIDGGEFETRYSAISNSLGQMFDVDGGTLTVKGGTFTTGGVMFDLFGPNGSNDNKGIANISGGTFTMGTQNCQFFKLGVGNGGSGGGIANVTGGTFRESTGIRTDDRNDGYFVYGNGEQNALRLSGGITLPTGELKIYLNGSSGSGINLENELKHPFTLLTSSGDSAYYLSAENTQWTDEQKALYTLPAGYVLDYSDSSKRMRLYKKEGHQHSETDTYTRKVSSNTKIIWGRAYLSEDVTIDGTGLENGKLQVGDSTTSFLCLNGKTLTLLNGIVLDVRLGSRISSREDEGRGKIIGGVMTDGHSTTARFENVDISSDTQDTTLKTYGYPANNLTLTNTNVINSKSGGTAVFLSGNYQWGNNKNAYTFTDSTITGPEDGIAVDARQQRSQITLNGTVNISGGKGLYFASEDGSIQLSSNFNENSCIEITPGRTFSISLSDAKFADCFVNLDPTNYVKHLSGKTLYFIKIDADTASDTNKVTVTASPDKVDYNGSVTLTATYDNSNREYPYCHWYQVDAEGNATLIKGADGWTYTTPALTKDTTYRAVVVSHRKDYDIRYYWYRLSSEDVTVNLNAQPDTFNADSVTAADLTYTGEAQSGYTGTPAFTNWNGTPTVTYERVTGEGESKTYTPTTAENSGAESNGGAPAYAGTYRVTFAIPGGAAYVGSGTLEFTIAPKPLTISGVTAETRDYAPDNTGVTLAGGTLVGVAEVDAGKVGFTLGSGTMFDANAGENKTVTTNITLNGAKAGNYTLTQPDVTVTIGKIDPTCTAPSNVTAVYGQKLGDIALTNPDGNTAGKWTWTNENTSVGDVSSAAQTFMATFTPTDTTNYNTKANIAVSVTVNKAAHENETLTGSAKYGNSGTVDLSSKIVSGGTVAYVSTTGEAALTENPTITADNKLRFAFTDTADNANKTAIVTLNVTSANYAEYQIVVTLTANDKDTQNITANDITVTYGDTDKSVTATGTHGTVTYAVKSGEDVVEVNETTGALTIHKAGSAVVTVAAAGDKDYKPAAKDVTVTVNRAALSGITVKMAGYTYGGTVSVPSVTGENKGSGTVTYYYNTTNSNQNGTKWENMTAVQLDADTYYLYAVIAETENYQAFATPAAAFTVSKANATATAPTAKSGLTYNGSAQALVEGGTADGGTMYYQVTSADVAAAPAELTQTTASAENAGSYKVWYCVKGDNNHNDTGVQAVEVRIAPKSLLDSDFTINETQAVYNGEAQNVAYTTNLTLGTDFTVGGTDSLTEVAASPATVTFTGKGNYIDTISKTWNLRQADYTGNKPASGNAMYSQSNTIDLANLIQSGGKLGTVTVSADADSVLDGTPTLNDNKLTFKFVADSGKIGKTATVTIPVTGCTNYKEYTIEVTLTVSKKDAANIGAINGVPAAVTYGDADFTLTAKAENAGTGTGTWTWSSSDSSVLRVTGTGTTAAVKILKAGSATVTATYESDTTYGTQTAGITVNQKALTLTAKDQSIYVNGTVPDLSKPTKDTHYTVIGLLDGDTLGGTITMKYQKDGADVAKPDVTTTGSYDIAISGGDAGGNYKISYTSGTLTISRRLSGGGAGGISNPGYSVTAPSTAENGSVTTSSKNATKGSTVTVTVKPDDGYQLDKLTVADANGNTITVTKKSDGKYTFTMPDSKVTITPTFRKIEDTKPSKNGFDDVASSAWYADAVQYVTGKGLMNGTGDNKFSPRATTTRGMLMTILARYAGEDTTGGAIWYEKGMNWAKAKGVSDGTNPTVNITREQLVTMLYRYAGSPAANGSLDGFSDAASVSAYAVNAMQWAVANGIINGSDGKLNPQDNATRAEVAAILMRFCEMGK